MADLIRHPLDERPKRYLLRRRPRLVVEWHGLLAMLFKLRSHFVRYLHFVTDAVPGNSAHEQAPEYTLNLYGCLLRPVNGPNSITHALSMPECTAEVLNFHRSLPLSLIVIHLHPYGFFQASGIFESRFKHGNFCVLLLYYLFALLEFFN